MLPTTLTIPDTMPPAERVALMERYVAEAAADPVVAALARQWTRGVDPRDRAAVAQRLLDALNGEVAYALDCGNGGCEIVASPRWTLAARRGDCKKRSMLYAAMARTLGIPARAVWIDQESAGAPLNHVAAQACMAVDRVKRATMPSAPRHAAQVIVPEGQTCNGGWSWVETTINGARVGEHPYDAQSRLGVQRADLAG